jgi:hypothetical protein
MYLKYPCLYIITLTYSEQMFQTIRLKAECSLNGPNLVFHINNKQIMARSKYEIWLKVYFHIYAMNPQIADQVFNIKCDSLEEYIDLTLTHVHML